MALRFIITDDQGSSGFSPDVHDAISNFLALGDADRLRASQAVYDNYRQTDGCEELPVHEPERIWEFVTPTEIYVSRRPSKDHVHVQLACECAWEPEHGLQRVYRRGMKLGRVSDQDGHLTYADAYGIRENEDPR